MDEYSREGGQAMGMLLMKTVLVAVSATDVDAGLKRIRECDAGYGGQVF